MSNTVDIIVKEAWDNLFDEIASHHYTSEQVERLLVQMRDKEREYRAQNALILSKTQAEHIYSLASHGATGQGDIDWLDEVFGPVMDAPREVPCPECGGHGHPQDTMRQGFLCQVCEGTGTWAK